MNITFPFPTTLMVAEVTTAFCGTYGYTPPVGPDGKTPLGNDTLGCDSLGVPTTAGLAFACDQIMNFALGVTANWQGNAVDAQSAAAKAQIAAAVAAAKAQIVPTFS